MDEELYKKKVVYLRDRLYDPEADFRSREAGPNSVKLEDLGLDLTFVDDSNDEAYSAAVGQPTVVELKPGGSEIKASYPSAHLRRLALHPSLSSCEVTG